MRAACSKMPRRVVALAEEHELRRVAQVAWDGVHARTRGFGERFAGQHASAAFRVAEGAVETALRAVARQHPPPARSPTAAEPLAELEDQRLQNIAENNEKLRALGLN